MPQLSRSTRVRLLFAAIGVFGAALAISGLLAALPKPAAGGTCGPSTGSETAIEAIVEPHSIGAGPEPPASEAAARQQWDAFVNDCQAAATGRLVAVLVILAVSVAVALLGPVLVLRRKRRTPSGGADLAPGAVHPLDPPPGAGYGLASYGVGAGASQGAVPYGAGPYGAVPYGGVPYGGVPYGGVPYGATPYPPPGPYAAPPYAGAPPGSGVATAPPPPSWVRDANWPAPAAPPDPGQAQAQEAPPPQPPPPQPPPPQPPPPPPPEPPSGWTGAQTVPGSVPAPGSGPPPTAEPSGPPGPPTTPGPPEG